MVYSDSLVEVERARAFLQEHAVGKIIRDVESFEDSIVFSGTTHLEFVRPFTMLSYSDAEN